MVMEFVPGRTLEAMLEEQMEPFPEERVLIWAEQLCDVLGYLHSQRPPIIYRDLKPGNVMVVEDTDTVKLLDMGIARTYKPGKQKDTIQLGTPGYAPPEQYGKAQTDERSDIYALGALLHHLLSLRDPSQHPMDAFPPLRSLNPQVSPHVEKAIARAVEKERSKRFASAGEMKEALMEETKAPARPSKKKAPPPSRAPAPKKAPPFQVSPSFLDWGQVVRGTDVPSRTLTVVHPAGAKVTAGADVPWLQTHTATVDDETTGVQVFLNTHSLPLGRRSVSGGGLERWVNWHLRLFVPESRHLQGQIEIALADGRSQKVPVTLIATPSPGRVAWGQVLALMCLHVAIPLLQRLRLASRSCAPAAGEPCARAPASAPAAARRWPLRPPSPPPIAPGAARRFARAPASAPPAARHWPLRPPSPPRIVPGAARRSGQAPASALPAASR